MDPTSTTFFAIARRGALLASEDPEKGHTLFECSHGACVHNEATWHKTSGYMRFVSLGSANILRGAVWELMVDRAGRIPVSKKGTDQRVKTLVGAWVDARGYDLTTSLSGGVEAGLEGHSRLCCGTVRKEQDRANEKNMGEMAQRASRRSPRGV